MNIEGWEKTKISQFGEIVTGSTPDTQNSDYWGGDTPFVSPSDFNSSAFVVRTDKTLTKEGVKQARNISKNSILVTCIGSIGGIAIAPWECVTNQQINSVICRKDFDALFVYFLIKNNLCKLQELAGITTLPIINKSTFGNIEIVCPKSKKEQEQIAEILSTIDRAIAQTEAIIAKQQRIKTGLMQDLLTKGIDEHGNIRSEATHEFKDSAIGRIPVEWEVSTLENQCIKVTDGTHQQVKTTEAGIPFLYVSCVREGMILWNRSAMIDLQTYKIISQGREPKHGVILYTVVGSYGYAALVETDAIFSFQRHIAYILPNQEKLDSKFLMEWMNSKKNKDYADKSALGNAQKTITLGELRQFPLFIPSKDEQAKIVQCLSKQNTIINQYCIVLDKLKTKKSGLMQDLLTGKVRVTELLKERDKIG